MKTKNKQDFDIDDMAIDGFVFYRSYFEAIKMLSAKNQHMLYNSITNYALNKEEPVSLPTKTLAVFKVIKPNLDANRRKYLKKAKSKSQALQRDTTSPIEDEFVEKVPLPKKEIESKNDNNNLDVEESDFI